MKPGPALVSTSIESEEKLESLLECSFHPTSKYDPGFLHLPIAMAPTVSRHVPGTNHSAPLCAQVQTVTLVGPVLRGGIRIK